MNLEHFKAFCWLRWRLLANQVTKGGILNQIILFMVVIGAAIAAVVLFVAGIVVGALVFMLPEIPDWVMLAVWDGVVIVFLFSWMIGLMQELQRSEALAIDKFLHLPVSISGVFVLNYLSSLMSLNLVVFVPMLVGFSLGLIVSRGPAMLLLLPLIAAFFLMVTALTYQFQGWLASLMVDKRRRRTIIALVTLLFILVTQVPNAINLYYKPWKMADPQDQKQAQAELKEELQAKKITQEEYTNRSVRLQAEQQQQKAERDRALLKQAEEVMWIASMVLPPGWLGIGAWGAWHGSVLPALMGILGMGLIGVGSLWRAYKTTLRLYTGQFTAGTKRPAPIVEPSKSLSEKTAPATLLETEIRGISGPAAVIAVATLRSLLRAPEGKMLLLSPVFVIVVFGGILMNTGQDFPEVIRPLFAMGAMAAILLFTVVGTLGNQFGYDRAGFKVYILSPVPRREILLGKNLSMLPMTAAFVFPSLIALEVLMPIPITYALALPFQFLSMFLVMCVPLNLLSILAPMGVAAGTMKPANPKLVPILLQMLAMFTMPVLLSPVLVVPWGVQAGLEALEVVDGVPICLVLSAAECAVIVALYRWIIGLEGRLLQYRELKILETVTAKSE